MMEPRFHQKLSKVNINDNQPLNSSIDLSAAAKSAKKR